MVLEGQIAKALNRALGDRLHGLDKSNLKLSLLNGEVTLRNVRVKSTALKGISSINSNVKVKAGYVGELKIKIPWRELGRKPVEVIFDRLHVLCEFRGEGDGDDSEDDESGQKEMSENERNKMKRALEEKKEKKRKQVNAKKRRIAESLERSWLRGDPTPGAEELRQKFWGDITKEEKEEEEEEEDDDDDDDNDDVSSVSSFDESEDDVEGEEESANASKRRLFSSPDTRRREEMFATPEYQPPLQTPENDTDVMSSTRKRKECNRGSTRKKSKSKKKKPVGFGALLDVVLANAVVTVKNIHFRFEGEGDENMPKFAVGASLESIALETTNVLGDSRAFIVDAFKETLRKKLEINNAVVYCDLNSVHLLEKVKNRDLKPHEDPIRFCKIMEACAKSKNRNRIIEPFVVTARYERAGMEAIESGTASALHGLTLNIPKTSANVSAGAASLAYWATQILKKSVHDRRFEHLRPGVPVFDGSEKVEEKSPAGTKTRRTNKNAQSWWQYACEAVKEETRERRERLGLGFSLDSKALKTLHEQRKAYVKVYIDEILQKSAPPPPSSKQNVNWPMKKPFGKIRKLDELESEIPNARMIAFFRQLAHVEWRKNGGCERAFRREAARRGGGPIPMKIVKGVAGVAGKGLLVGVKVIKNVGFKPLGAAKRFITNIGKNQQERDELDAIKKREIEEARIRAEEDEENLKRQIRQIRKKNAATPVKHLFATPSRPPRNAPNEFDNRDAAISDDESQIDWDEVGDTFDIKERQEYAEIQKREMQSVEKKSKIPMFATCIAFEEISMKILDASSNERNDHDDAFSDSLAPSSSTSFSSFAEIPIKESELFSVSINNFVIGAKMMGISFVKDAIDVRSTIDTIRFSAPEGDLLALGEDETDYYSSYSTHGMGMSLPIMLAKLFNADLNDAEDTISNGRPRCFSGSPVSKAVSFAASKKRKITNKNTELSISLETDSATIAGSSLATKKCDSNTEVEKAVGYCALILSPMFITILRGPIDRIVDVFTRRMKGSCMQSRFNTSAQITPELDVIPRGSIEASSGVSSSGDLSLPKIGLAVFVGKVHLAVPSQRKNRKKKGTTLIARFGPLTARTLKSAQNAHVQEQDANARSSWRKRTIEGKLLDCSIGFADNFAWTCNQSWQLLSEAGESNRVETPLLSRVQCTILASHYVLSPREALKYSPVVVDVNLPSIQLSVSPERINMALRVATQFTESAKKVADEAKRIKEQKKQRNDIASSQSDKILKSGDDDDEKKITFSSSLPSSFSSGRKDTDDIFARDIDVFNCERLVPADLFGELPYWESCDVFVREGTLSVVDKPAGSVHHLEPRVLKLAGTRGAGNPLTRTQEKVEVCVLSIDEKRKTIRVKLHVSTDSDEILRKMNDKDDANREYSEYDRTLIVGDALLDRSIESNFERMCEHPNGFVFRFWSKDICDVIKSRLNMEARLLPFHEEVRRVLKVDEHKTKKASVTFSMGLFGFHLAAPLRHHNHETDLYVNDMSKSYFIDQLADDEKIKYVVDCFQERPLANVKITGLTLSCEATKGSVTLGAGLRRVAIKDCWTIEGIGKDHDAVFIEKPLRDELSTKYLKYKTDAMKKSCVGFSLEAFLPSHPEYGTQAADLRMAVSSIETHIAREPIAAFTSFRFLFKSPVSVGKGWPSRYDDSVFAPSREEWESMRQKLQKVKIMDASKLAHKIKLNFTFHGDSLVAKLYDDPKKSVLAADTRRQPILEATVSNFHSRLYIRAKPVGKQGWGGGKQGTKDLEISCDNLTLSDPTLPVGHANRDLIAKDNAASDFLTFFLEEEKSARKKIRNIPFLWIRRQTWLPHEHEDDIDIELEAKVAPLRVLANQNCIINIANCLLPIFKTLSPPHFLPNLPPFVFPRPGFVTKKVKITANVMGSRVVLPGSVRDEIAPSLSLCVGVVDKNASESFKGIDVSTSFTIDANRAHWAKFDIFIHGLSVACKGDSTLKAKKNRSSALLRASGPLIKRSDAPVALKATCWNRLDARRQLSNAPSVDINVQLPANDVLTVEISASDVETLNSVIKGYTQTSTMTYTQSPFAYCYLTPAKYPLAPPLPKKDFLIHQCFQARIDHIQLGIFAGKGRASQVVEAGIRGISFANVSNPRNELRSELAVGVEGLYARDCRFKGYKIDLIRAGFCDEAVVNTQDKNSSNEVKASAEGVEELQIVEEQEDEYLQSMFLSLEQVTTNDISEVSCQCGRVAVIASVDSLLEAARIFQPKLGAGENILPQDILFTEERKIFKLRENMTLSRTRRVLADFPTSSSGAQEYVLDGCEQTINLDYSDTIYLEHNLSKKDKTKKEGDSGKNSKSGDRAVHLAERELQFAPRIIIGPNHRLVIKNCRIVCPDKETFDLCIRMASGGSYFVDPESVQFLSRQEMMLEKKKIVRRQRTLGNGDGDSFSEQGVEEFRDSRLTEIEMKYLMNSWRGRVKTVVAVLRELRNKPGYSISANKRIEGARAVIGLKGKDKLGDALLEVQKEAILKVVDKQRKKSALKCVLKLHSIDVAVFPSRDPDEGLCASFSVHSKINIIGSSVESSFELEHMCVSFPDSARLNPLVEPCKITATLDSDECYNETEGSDNSLEPSAPRRETSIDVMISPIGVEVSPAAAGRVIRLAQRVSSIVATQPLLPCNHFALVYSSFEGSGYDADFGASAADFFSTGELIPQENALAVAATGARSTSFSFWRPRPVMGYCSLGDVPNFGPDSPTRSATSIRDSMTYCSPPSGFKRINPSKKSDASSRSNLVLWQPVPRKGYRALGLIAAYEEDGEPDPSCVRCVRESLLCESTGSLSRLFSMSDEESNKPDDRRSEVHNAQRRGQSKVLNVDDDKSVHKRDIWGNSRSGNLVHVWAVDSPTGIHMVSSAGKSSASNALIDPPISFVDIRTPLGLAIETLENIQARKLENKRRRRLLKKEIAHDNAITLEDEDYEGNIADIKLCVVTAVEFEKVWNAGEMLTGFRPLPPPGFASLGDVVVDGVAHPSMTRCVEDLEYVCVKPIDFELVFQSSKKQLQAAFWRPVSPSEDYVSCGLVSTSSANVKPSLDSVRCLSRTHCGAVAPMDVTLLTKESSLLIIHGGKSSTSEMCMWRVPGGFGTFCISKADMPNDIYKGPTLFVLPSISSLDFSDEGSRITSFAYEKPKPIVKISASVGLVTVTVAAPQRIVANDADAKEDTPMDVGDDSSYRESAGIMHQNVPVFAISLMRTEIVTNVVVGDVASVGIDASLGAAHLNWRKYAWEPLVSPQWVFGANLVPIKHGERCFSTGNYASIQATKLCITLTTDFALDMVSIALETKKEIMRKRDNFDTDAEGEIQLDHQSSIAYPDNDGFSPATSHVVSELEVATKELFPDRSSALSESWKEKRMLIKHAQKRSKSRDSVLRCFSNTGLTTHATLSSVNQEVENEVIRMKNDTGRTLYTVSRKSLQRGKDEDVRVVPPHGNFDVNFCIAKETSQARQRVVDTNTADVQVAPPLESLTAKMMVEIIDVDDPMESMRNDVNRSSGVPDTYSRISCVLKSNSSITHLRSLAISNKNYSFRNKVRMRLANNGDESRVSLPFNAKSGYITMDVPHPASRSRDFQNSSLRVDLERPCSTHDFVEDANARFSAEGFVASSLALLVGEEKPVWIDLHDENGIPTKVRILLRASIFHNISVKVPIHINRHGRIDSAKNAGACNIIFKRMLSSSSALSAFRDHDDSDSDRSDASSSCEGTVAEFDDDEFEELKNFTQEDNVDSRRNRDQHERLIEDSESVSVTLKSDNLLFSDNYCNITKTYEFKLLWWSKGTGAKYECSAWIPVAKIDSSERSIDGSTEDESIVEIPFGCIVVPGFSAPNTGGYLARMVIDDHVKKKMPRAGAPFAHPIGYELLWKDEKKSSVSFWAPIPPEGYVALGRVVTADNGKSKEQKQPSKKSFCCVREDFARELSTIGPGAIWKPQGTKNTYASKGDSKAQVPTIYNAGSVASGGWTIRHTSKRAPSGEPLEVQTKEATKFQALTKNFELNFLSGRMRVKHTDISPNLKISKLSTNDISALKNKETEEVDPEDTLIAFSKNGPYAAIKASGTDFFERKDQDVGEDKVTVDPRLGVLMSQATFVNETSERFSLTLVKLKNNAGNSKVNARKPGLRSPKDLTSASEEKNDLNGFFEEGYDPNDPMYRYVWESERHFPPFGWKSPRDILDACFTARYSLNIDGSNSTNHFPEGESLLLPEGYHWMGDWEIDRPPGNCTVSNTGGWAYDAYWVTSWPPNEFKNAKNWKRRFASTRRRRWRRKIAPIEEYDETNVFPSSSLSEGGASSARESGEKRDKYNSQTNMFFTPNMNRKRNTNERRATMEDTKAGKGSSWSIEVSQSGGNVCFPVGFENTEQCAIRFVPVSTEKQGVQNVTHYENDEICSESMETCDILCESLRERWESVIARDNNDEHSDPDVICTADNKFYLVYLERQKRGDKNNKRALSRNIHVVLRVPLVLRNSLPCEAKYVVYCDKRASVYGIMKPGEELFISESVDPRQEISCAYGLRASSAQKQSERWNMSEPMPITAFADGVTRGCVVLKNVGEKIGAQGRRLEAKLLVTASKYSGVLKKDGKVVSRDTDNRPVSSIADDVAKNVKHAIGYVQEESSPSNISAMFVDIRADVIVHNACPFPVSLCTEPEDETNLIQISKIEEVVDTAVGKFIVKKPTGELFEVKPGNINVSLRAEQKLNVDAAVRATVGVVDGVLKNIQKAFVAEISSHVHTLFLAEDVDELENVDANKRVHCIVHRGVKPGEAPCLVTLRTKSYGEVRIKIVAEHFHPVLSQSQHWWSYEMMSRTVRISVVPEIILVNISHIPLAMHIKNDDDLKDERKMHYDNSAMTIPIGAAPVLPGSSSPERARLIFRDASGTRDENTHSYESFSAEIRMDLLQESGEQLLAVPQSVTKDGDSKVSSSLIRVRLQTAQIAGSTQIIIGSAAKSDRSAESGIRIENHTRVRADFSRILLRGESNVQKRYNFADKQTAPAMASTKTPKKLGNITSMRTNNSVTRTASSSLYDESNFGEGVRVPPRSASHWLGPRFFNGRSEGPTGKRSQKSSDESLLPKVGESVRVVRLSCSNDENVEESYFELPELGDFRDASIVNSRTSGGGSSSGGGEEEFGALGSITLAEGFICDDPSGKYEICYRLSCIFFDGAETGAEECISLRLMEFKVEIDPDVQDRNSNGSPRFAKQPTVLDRESRDAVLSVNDADAAAAIIKGHFMSRLANRNKRKGKGRMNDFEADLKAFQRIQNITKTSREIHIGAIFDGIQISLVDSRRELCLFTVNGIEASFGNQCNNGRGLYAKFAIVSAQLDNMLENALYPVTMFNDAASGCLFAASFSMRESRDINRFPEVRMVWAPSGLNVLIHEPLLWALKEYVEEIGIERLFAEDGGDASEMSSSKDSRMKKDGGKKVTFKAKKQKTVSANIDHLISVGTFSSDGIRAFVTLTSAPSSRPKNAPMMMCATLNLLRLDRLPIAIAPFNLPTNATLKLSDLRRKMKSHVIKQFTIQSGRILASVDNAGTVSVGLRRAQDKLAELSGDTSKNIVASRERGATTSISAGVKNIGQTYVDGTVNLVGGALSGVAGVFYKPVQGFRQEGLRGAALGGIKGITGLVTSTLGGAVGLVETAFSGLSQAMSVGGILSKSTGSLEATRARKPLALRGDGIVRTYDEEQSAGADLLRVAAKKIAYVEEIQASKVDQDTMKKKGTRKERKTMKNANKKTKKSFTTVTAVNERTQFTFGRFELFYPLAHVSDAIVCLTDTHLVWIERYETDPTATRFLRWHEVASIYISSSLDKKTVCVQVGVCDSLREENKVTTPDFGFTSSLLTVVKEGAKSKNKSIRFVNHNDFRSSTVLCPFQSSEDANRILAQMRTLWEQAVTDRRQRFGFQASPLLQN